jgi:hypothetical protein
MAIVRLKRRNFMLTNIVYLFKTHEEWIILKEKNFSYKEIGKKGVTECNYNSIRALT